MKGDHFYSGTSPRISACEIFESTTEVVCGLSISICLIRVFWLSPKSYQFNIRKDFPPVTSSISARHRHKCLSERCFIGSTRIGPWGSVVTDIKIFVAGFITFCSATYIFGEFLPFSDIYSCFYGNCGAFKNLLFRFLMIFTAVPSLSSTKCLRGWIYSTYLSKTSHRGWPPFLVGRQRRKSTSPTA